MTGKKQIIADSLFTAVALMAMFLVNLFLVTQFDTKTMTPMVFVDQKVIHVTQTEFNILSFLSQNTGKVMTYSAIIHAIWGAMDDGSIKKLQVNMANIRKKLNCKPGENRYIINDLGVGYRMLDPQE